MSIPGASDPKSDLKSVPKVESFFERILPRIEKGAGVKNSEMFRVLMLDVVDRAYDMASRGPVSLKRTKRIGQLVCKLQKALNDDPDLSRHLEHIQRLEHVSAHLEHSDSLLTAAKVSNLADALSQTASALHWLEPGKKNRGPGKWRRGFASSSSAACSTRLRWLGASWGLIGATGGARLSMPSICSGLIYLSYFSMGCRYRRCGR